MKSPWHNRQDGVSTLHELKHKGVGTGYFSIAIPAKVGKHLRAGMKFTAEITPDGILFKPYNPPPEAPEEVLPGWVKS